MIQSTPPEGFKACEVTGQVLPADSLVQFQGKWVGPEGKQILLERMQSGEPIEGTSLQRPGFWRRFGCIFLDGLILFIPSLVINVLFGAATWNPANTGAKSAFVFSRGMLLVGVGELLMFAIGTAYFGILQGYNGQTLGKRSGREKVVRLDGSPIDMKTGILRGAYYCMPGAILAVGGLSTIISVFGVCYVLSILWSLADIICLVADSRMQRALHDRLAGTRVILLPPN